MKPWPALLIAVTFVAGGPAGGQEPSPPPARPELVFQDELDLQANANFVQGSGARAFGMGGAFLARPDDSTAASWNPAGLSYLKDPEFSFVLVDSRVTGERGFEGVNTFTRGSNLLSFEYHQDEHDQRSGRFADFIAVALPWEAGEASGAIQASYQRVVPFTSSRTIEDVAVGTVTNTGNGETSPREERSVRRVETTGGFDILTLGAGARLTRKLRLGFTLNRWLHGYEQTLIKRDQTVPSRLQSEMDLSGWNMHLGLIVTPIESLNIGIVYKSGFTADATLGRVRYDEYPATPITPAVNNFNIYSRDDVGLVLPGAFGIGLSWRPRSSLTLSADYTRTNWSGGRIRNFFALPRSRATAPLDRPAPDPLESRNFCGEYPEDYKPKPLNPCPPVLPYPTLDSGSEQADTKQIRVGAEYVLQRSRLRVPLRAGYFRDSQFFLSLEGDAPTFDGFTVGTGLILGNVLFDMAYVYESGRYTDRNLVEERDPNTGQLLLYRGPTSNDVKFHKVYASVIYRLPRRR